MTEEQVARLERLADGIGLIFPNDRPLYERLLEERKRLLTELKVEVAEHGRSYSIAALAYAEEAAP